MDDSESSTKGCRSRTLVRKEKVQYYKDIHQIYLTLLFANSKLRRGLLDFAFWGRVKSLGVCPVQFLSLAWNTLASGTRSPVEHAREWNSHAREWNTK